MGVPYERYPSVLQGEGGDAVGGVVGVRAAKIAALHTAATSAADLAKGFWRDVLLECQFGAIFLNGCTEEFWLAQGNRKKHAGCACRAATPLFPVA